MATEVIVLHTDFVSNLKFEQLKPIAAKQSVQLQHINIEQDDRDLKPLIQQADVVVLDVPRPSDREMVEQRSLELLKALNTPYMTVGGGAPEFQSIPKLFGFHLLGLYANGGERNFQHYFQAVHAWKSSGEKLKFEIEKLPEIAVFHPKAEQYFADLSHYQTWFKTYSPKAPLAKLVYLMSPNMVTNLTTQQLDDLVQLTEAKGVMPIIVLWSESKAKTRLTDSLQQQGISAVVNLTHIQQGQKIVEDLKQLNIPMLQGLHFRNNSSAWQSAQSGVAAQMTAMFIALPETWGISDPLILSSKEGDQEKWLVPQVNLLLDKVISQAKLQQLTNAKKKVAVMYWNYPNGQQNLSAANLNIPQSLQNIEQSLKRQGYQTEQLDEQRWIRTAQQLLTPFYQPEKLAELEQQGLLAYYPVSKYQAWVASLPETRQQELKPQAEEVQLKQHWAVVEREGQSYFAIPRAQLGHLTLLPQPPRSMQLAENYHSSTSVPDALYLATYLYLQQEQHALIHLGTHGTQEWLPGKDRGLAAEDYPYLTAGGLPIFYPYIQDNIAEAIQAKRRGRAVTISHQTAPLAPSGLYDELRDLHDLVHQYVQLDDGAVKQKTQAEMISVAQKSGIAKDLNLSSEEMQHNFDQFFNALHDHLHALAQQAVPMGLHKFGQSAKDEQRLIIVMQQLDKAYLDALGLDFKEDFPNDLEDLKQSLGFRFLAHHLLAEQDHEVAKIRLNATLKSLLDQARHNYANLAAEQEIDSLVNALNGGFVLPGNGGDPIRQPDAVSGRNLYAFDASKIPTPAAYDIGTQTFQQLIEQYQKQHHGQYPKKIAFSLWSSETVRHLGVTEAQLLHALGLKPIWNKAGNLISLDIIPREQLQRPRIDAVVQVTSVYRDQFDHFMRLVSQAIEQLSELNEADNPIYAHAQTMEQTLKEKNIDPEQAKALSHLKFFSNQPGEYGSGLTQKALAYDDWENDHAVANTFLNNLQYAYGKQHSGDKLDVNLFAENLKQVDVAVMSRSSNIHGVLSTDHAFEYLGGLSMAIRQLQGHSPELLITDLRQNKSQISTLKAYLANELRTRYLNPTWIKQMQAEGYAGTLEVLNVTNNLYGWNVTDSSVVRDDQWQDLYDTYIRDKRGLGTQAWFQEHNPTVQLQVLNRMAEAIRQSYWQADDQTRQEIAQKIQQLQQSLNVPAESKRITAFVESILLNQPEMEHPINSVEEELSSENVLAHQVKSHVATVSTQRDGLDSNLKSPSSRGQGLHMLKPHTSQNAAQDVTPPQLAHHSSIVQGQTLQQVAAPQTPQSHTWMVMLILSCFVIGGFGYQYLTQRQYSK